MTRSYLELEEAGLSEVLHDDAGFGLLDDAHHGAHQLIAEGQADALGEYTLTTGCIGESCQGCFAIRLDEATRTKLRDTPR